MAFKFNRKPTEELLLENPPFSEDGEKAILSCLLNSPTLIEDAKENLSEAFYGPVHKMLLEEMILMNSMGIPVDVVTFSQHLIDRSLMEKVGPAFIAELLSFAPSSTFYPHYSGIVRDKAKSRQVMIAALGIMNSMKSNQADLSLANEEISARLVEIGNAIKPEEPVRGWDEEMDEWSADWDSMASGKKESAMPIQWRCWNESMGGLRAGYSIFSGTSSSGKSTLVGNIMNHACILKKRPGLIINYEMPVRSVISRLVADIADVDGADVFAPDRAEPDASSKKKIASAISEIRKSPLRIIHMPSLSAEGACSMARKMFLDKGDLVLAIDYIQLIPRPSSLQKNANRETEVAQNSAIFRTFSKEIDCPVIALSQLNQDGTTRESAGINNDCDEHVRIERTKDIKSGKVTEKGVWIAKNRNGRSDFLIPLFLNGPRFRFEERNSP